MRESIYTKKLMSGGLQGPWNTTGLSKYVALAGTYTVAALVEALQAASHASKNAYTNPYIIYYN